MTVRENITLELGEPSRADPAPVHLARNFAEKVRSQIPGRIKQIILYGSRARGDYGPDSDYDVLIVVENQDLGLEDKIMEVAAEWQDRYEAFITPLLCTEHSFERYRDDGLLREISREGIRL